VARYFICSNESISLSSKALNKIFRFYYLFICLLKFCMKGFSPTSVNLAQWIWCVFLAFFLCLMNIFSSCYVHLRWERGTCLNIWKYFKSLLSSFLVFCLGVFSYWNLFIINIFLSSRLEVTGYFNPCINLIFRFGFKSTGLKIFLKRELIPWIWTFSGFKFLLIF